MKKLTILATVAMIALCTSAMGITIFFQGNVTQGGVPLQVVPGSLGPAWDYENIGVNPLIDVFVNGALRAQTTVGAGNYSEPVNGNFNLTVSGKEVGALAQGDVITARAYLSADGSGLSADSSVVVGPLSEPPAPADVTFDFGTIDIVIPEPSLMLSGLALLLLRRKK